jgi:glycosyltransferase involved in cell wall biosynthesis
VAGLSRHDGPKLRLVCLGDGRLRRQLQTQAQQLGLGETVLFLGYCPQIEAWLAVADVFVLPSLYEGLPLSVMEAAAAGCAIVATAVDGTPELLADGRDGLLVPPGNPEALAQALLRLIADAGLRKALGEHVRQRARDEFDQARQIAATAALYLELGQARAARRGQVPAASCRPPAVGGGRG